jgi:NAD(P)-dependent dehydrogenase (short-subunit alcohol dehydrogenase family)
VRFPSSFNPPRTLFSVTLTRLSFPRFERRRKLTDLETNWQVNVVGNVRVVQAFLPLVQRSKERSIVAISSGAGSTDWKLCVLTFSYFLSRCM